jgi:tetratricopeptide (TPR) repeat protein
MSREEGNARFREGAFALAVQAYTAALASEPSAALYSNRSASYAALCAWADALADAESAVALDVSWLKHRPPPPAA